MQGVLGVCEVLFSTFLCTLTALVVLVTGVSLQGGAVTVALHAFEAAMGPSGSALLCLMLTFFALSTLPVWWFYGKQCVAFLCRHPLPQRIYTVLFLLITLAGSILPLDDVWGFADVLNLLLALPGLMMLMMYRREF